MANYRPQLRAIETTDIERRLATLERLSSQADEGLGRKRTTQERDLGNLPLVESASGGFDGDGDAQSRANRSPDRALDPQPQERLDV